jgi:hypothetical protein
VLLRTVPIADDGDQSRALVGSNDDADGLSYPRNGTVALAREETTCSTFRRRLTYILPSGSLMQQSLHGCKRADNPLGPESGQWA